ncbi:M56 family metallopeptidase, partial [Sphingomonas sp.]|uniref:M56 family metallopeptidase n=1 Tax=Sphingomonas sp. TaxID=28214 RepID=UPI0031DF11A3
MIAWVVETFVATTLLMLLVLAIRKPVSRHFGPNIAYALWALPVLRLALPPLPESWRASAETPVAAASEVITYYVVEPITVPQAAATAAAPVAQAAPIDWLPILLAIWAAGALAFLGYHLIAHGRFCARLLRRARVERTVAEGRVHVIETDAATGPLAFGIWRKYVAFPRDFHERYDPLERNLALAHELGHHLRGDLIANWIALVVLALHWFNPVAWRAFRAFRADQEMACDALVLSGRAPALRHAYGRAIV